MPAVGTSHLAIERLVSIAAVVAVIEVEVESVIEGVIEGMVEDALEGVVHALDDYTQYATR